MTEYEQFRLKAARETAAKVIESQPETGDGFHMRNTAAGVRAGAFDDKTVIQACLAAFDAGAAWMRERALARWHELPSKMPPLHQSVLVRLRNGVGEVLDVACYTGKDVNGLDRWIVSGVAHLETKQLTHWTEIAGPDAIRAIEIGDGK
jgi:hypothetical protein